MNPVRLAVAAAALLAAFVALSAALSSTAATARISPEARRKIVHGAMGTLAAALPWLVDGPLGVPLLATLFALVVGLARRVPVLRDGLARAWLGVDRASVGDLAFPCGLAIAWPLAGASVAPYVVGALLLAWADSAAALVGRAWTRSSGPHARRAPRKTGAGTLAFALTAAATTAAVLVVADEMPVVSAVLVAVAVAAVTALVEALASGGWDNLVLPPAACVLVRGLRAADGSALCGITAFAALALWVLLRETTPHVADSAPGTAS